MVSCIDSAPVETFALAATSKHMRVRHPRLDTLLQRVYERQDQSSGAMVARIASLERQIGLLNGQFLASTSRYHDRRQLIPQQIGGRLDSWEPFRKDNSESTPPCRLPTTQ
ncbi:unnamed protein product [Symbiodinium natans]|uniref:Uncharacterized protein n=1 Tax=Symbiodinium natans TaxID=878477 RepID=A0A812JCH4_9DINO|nr:unnamed protein product [Symbiodinium natans]